MISVITRQYGLKDDSTEVTNICININGYLVSIGVAKSHYCSPRTFQGMNPERSKVEVCVINQSAEYITSDVFDNALNPTEVGKHLFEDDDVVGWVETSDLIKVLAYVKGMSMLQRNKNDA
tara:strand:- start:1297 stop:1659 length:363 start_codon:yes stop_codon:yes gene_type:complete